MGYKKLLTGHVIKEIDYSKNYLLCVCTWEGEALNDKAFRKHQKESEPYTGDALINPYAGRFNTTFIDREFKDLVTVG